MELSSRYKDFQEALAGYERTGVPLIAYDGKVLKPSGYGDDIGAFYFVPKIAQAFHLPLDQSIVVFSVGMMVCALALGMVGSLLLFKTRLGRWVAVGALLLLTFILFETEGDVYLASPALTVAVVPLFLYFAEKKKISIPFCVLLFLAGVGIGTAHYVRGHAGTGAFIFMACIIFFHLQTHWKQKSLLILLIAAGALLPALFFNRLLNQRDAYLRENAPQQAKVLTRQHIVWHSIYIGLGYVSNVHGLSYGDAVAFNKARSIAPDVVFYSPEYEAVLRHEVFKLIREHPRFVLCTVFAKLGVICFYLLTFANVGLLAAVQYRKPRSLEVAFWVSMGFNALIGILVIPQFIYLTGFVAFATLYGVTSINHAIERRGAERDFSPYSRSRGES